MAEEGLTPEDIALIESFGGEESDTDSERRKKYRRLLIEMGVIEPTQSDLIDFFGEAASSELGGESAEDMFRRFSESPGVLDPTDAFRRTGERASEEREFESSRSSALDLILGLLTGSGGSGRTFRPSVMQQPSEADLFKSVEQAELGPASDLVFRDVYDELFPDVGQGEGPFEQFAQKQAKEFENQFMTDTFKKFNEPGFMDTLRADYEGLYRQKERGDFDGAGGDIPAFEDFIKERVTGDYRSYLTSQTSMQDLRSAFELASPEARGQRDAGSIAPPRRIL